MAKKPNPLDEKVLSTYSVSTVDGIPTLIFIITQAAWEKIREPDMHHNFDLTKLGIPIRVFITRTKDHDTGMQFIRKVNERVKDVRNVDISIDRPN